MTKFGASLDNKNLQKNPLILTLQMPTQGYVEVTSPDDINDWEERVQEFYGIDPKKLGPNITRADTCSGGRLDDCGYLV